MKFSSLILIYYLATIGVDLMAQETELLKLRGFVLSKETNNPVSYAHIRIQNSTIGTVTNSEGEFALSFNSSYLEDTVVFSSLAFKSFKLPLTKIMVGRDLEIMLQRGDMVLEEMHVEDDGVSSFELVQKAVSKIEENYETVPVALTEFYREYASVYAKELSRTYESKRKAKKSRNLDESYAYNITEGVFEVYKYPYSGKMDSRDDKVKLIKGRRLEYHPQTPGDSVIQSLMVKFKHKGGPHDMLIKDPLQDPDDASFLHRNADKKYNFKTVGLVDYNGRGTFKVIFDQKDKVRDDLFKGEIYIDTANYAFVHIVFKKSPKGLDHQSFGVPLGMIKFMTGIKMELTDFQGNLSYQEYRGKWYPEYHQYNGKLHVTMDKDKAKKDTKMDIFLEMRGDLMVTNIDKRHVRKFEGDEEFKKSDALDDFVGEYGDEFWQTHNYILPSEELLNKINKSKKR